MTLADFVLYIHFAYVAAVVLPVPLILLGRLRSWSWVRHRGFRTAHLAMMGVVVAETVLGVVCPLTWLERALRGEGGEQGFLSAWVSRLLFYDLPPLFFAAAYCALFALMVGLWWVVPPARKGSVPPARKRSVPPARGGSGQGARAQSEPGNAPEPGAGGTQGIRAGAGEISAPRRRRWLSGFFGGTA